VANSMYIWAQAGFDCHNIDLGGASPNALITAQSLPAGSQADCSEAQITVTVR